MNSDEYEFEAQNPKYRLMVNDIINFHLFSIIRKRSNNYTFDTNAIYLSFNCNITKFTNWIFVSIVLV